MVSSTYWTGVLAKPQTKSSFQKALYEKGIRCILRENDDNRIYGVTFIDQKNKAVFNGSDLGKAYSANQLSAQLLPEPKDKAANQQHDQDLITNNTFSQTSTGSDELIDILFAAEREDLVALNKFKRKKRKGLNL
jgi:hypothetical protein